MVLEVVVSDGHRLLSISAAAGDKVITAVYYKLLRCQTVPWFKQTYPVLRYAF
jgi:hypothetical protein